MTKRMALAVLALAGMFVALYLLLYKLGMIGELNCSVGSCETVNTSKWATFIGLPVAAWGVAFYLGMFALALLSVQPRYADSKGMSQVLVLFSGSGVVFSAWLTYLELFVIHAICQWCVVSAVIVTSILVLALIDYRDFD
ncbi:MAG: vitamin K epoxide reductase family protein [Gemmatimonadaceae bacterium]